MKKIYILSDATGQSAMDVLRAALAQFENPQVKFTVFPKVESKDKLRNILLQAIEDNAFVAFTFVKKGIREFVHGFCQENKILHSDILGNLIHTLSQYLRQEPLESPKLLRKIDERYLRRIEAIEYAVYHDDGRSVREMSAADVVILGLSRTSKTPTSLFLAQQGFRVVNIPIVPEIPLSEEIYKIDQNKIVCLVMDPEVLQKVRLARLSHYKTDSSYTDLKKIFEECEYVRSLCRRNKRWKVVNTTNKSVEETSREIINYVYGRDIEL